MQAELGFDERGDGVEPLPQGIPVVRWVMAAALLSLNFLDVVTTKLILSAGGSEANPVMAPLVDHPYAAYALKLSMAMGVGVFELVAGLLLAIGLMSRLIAIVLFVYVGATILFFHNAFNDPAQQVNALKNLAMMGGLLMVFAYGQMRWSYDHWRERHRTRKAELRAAHAEGKAEGATAMAAHPATETVVRDHDGEPRTVVVHDRDDLPPNA